MAGADYYALLATAQTALRNPDAAKAAYAAGYALLHHFDDGSIVDNTAGGVYLRGMLCVTATGQDATALTGPDCARLRVFAAIKGPYADSALEALAQAEMLAGDLNAALEAIGQLLGKSYSSLRYTMPLTPALLRQDPLWAPLRGEARFQKLVAQ